MSRFLFFTILFGLLLSAVGCRNIKAVADGGADGSVGDGKTQPDFPVGWEGNRDGNPPMVDGPTHDGAVAPPLAVPGKSGTRLRRVFYEAGGSRILAPVLHDTLLDAPCSWQTIYDGSVRCVPEADYSAYAVSTSPGVPHDNLGGAYEDPGCSQPIIGVPESQADSWTSCGVETKPFFFPIRQTVDGLVCADNLAELTSHTIGALYQGISRLNLQKYYNYNSVQKTCVEYEAHPSLVYYRVKIIDPTTLPLGTTTAGVKKSRIEERLVASADGLETQLAFFDAQRSELCQLRLQADNKRRCLPLLGVTTPGSGNIYKDANCSVGPLTYASGEVCVPPKYAVLQQSDGCSQTTYAVNLVGKAAYATYRLGGNGECTEWHQTDHHYEIGGAVEPSAFVEGALTPHPGSARIQPLVHQVEGLSLITDAFWDTKHKIACQPRLASDGLQRCLPSSTLATVRYLDDQCQNEVIAIRDCPAGPTDRFALVGHGTNGCEGVFRVLEFGAQSATTAAYRKTNSGCEAWSLPADWSLYQVAAEMSATEFEVVKQVIE